MENGHLHFVVVVLYLLLEGLLLSVGVLLRTDERLLFLTDDTSCFAIIIVS